MLDFIRDATREDIEFMSIYARDEHKQEVRDVSNIRFYDALCIDYGNALGAFVAEKDKLPLMYLSVAPASALTGLSFVSIVGTKQIDEYPRAAIKAARWGIQTAYRLSNATGLEQYIPAWYETGLKFVKHIGFTLKQKSNGLYHAVHERRE